MELAAPAQSNVVVVTPQRVATLKAVIDQDTCTVPAAAGKPDYCWFQHVRQHKRSALSG
jgi:hypothetical protein